MQDSFVFYKSFYEALTMLPPVEYKEAMDGLLKYVFEDDEPIFEHTTSEIIFTLVKPQIDANMKRRADGAKGGRPKTIGYETEKPVVMDEAENEKPNVNVNVNANVNVNDNKKKSEKKRFSPPTLEELKAYCQEKSLSNVDPEKFIDYYAAKGWVVGKQPMKDWKAAARNWNRNDFDFKSNKQDVTEHRQKSKFHNFDERQYDYAALMSEAMG